MAEFVANFNLNNNNLDASFDLSEGASFDALFEIYAGSVTWGNILGDITNQTDLQDVLDSKASNERVDGIVEAFNSDIENINDSITELSENLDDLESTVTDNYNELNSAIDSNHQAISNINNTIQGYGDIVTYNASYFATSAQGALADTALQPNDNISELTNDVGYITSASLPVVNNNRITIQKNGSPVGDFTLNQANDEAININVPTTAADVGALPDTTTINDLTTMAQQEALNSGANTTNIGQISANAQAIQTETNNRTNADNNLQSQIDAITAASDVTDIVGTYAELQAYDTTNLPNNSIIKVLQDESRDNETTYYRWVITGGVGAWVLIGEEGPYYTKSESDSTFVPQTRTINGKALSSNINLDASDVGALPDSTIIPTVNNGTLTIQANGTTVGTFTANQAGNTTANIVVPDSATWGNITGTLSNQTDLQNALNAKADISSLATVATSGSYNDLTNKPTIGNGTVTFTQDGVTKGTITMNQSGDTTIALEQGGDVTDVEVNGESVVTDGVAEIDLTGYQPKLTAGTDLEIVEGSTLPAGYVQLKSISSTTTQYINTKISMTANYRAVIVGRLTQQPSSNFCTILGADNQNYNVSTQGKYNVILGWGNAANGFYTENCIPSGAILDYTYSSYPWDTETHTFTVAVTPTQTTLNIDGTINTIPLRPAAWDVPTPLYLFARNTAANGGIGGITPFELEKIEQYQNGVLVFNGIPCKLGDIVGLYNTVTNEFLPNSGTGAFVEGDVIPNETIINFTNETGYITSASVNTLTDVDLTNLTDGDVLVYDSTSQEWKAEAQSGGVDLTAGTDLEIVNVSSHGLPSGYTLLEWVESSGLQALSLGFSGNCTIEFTVQMAHVPTNNEVLLTSSVNAAAGTWFGVNSDNTWSYTEISGSTKVDVVMNATAQGLNGTINGDSFSRNVPATHGTWTLFNNIPASSSSSTYPSFMKLFALKVTQNGVVIRNLIPCKNNNNVVGLYDTINSVFYSSTSGTQLIAGTVIPTGKVINFTNESGYALQANVDTALTLKQDLLTAGTDLEIITGSGAILPDTYEELEYIQSDGACYIDTGIISYGTDTIEQKFQKLGTSTATCSWFGSMQGTSLIRVSIGSYLRVSDQQVLFFGGFNYTQGIGTADTNEHIIKLYGGSVIELDGTSTVYTPQTNTNPTVTSYLFARHGYDTVNTVYDNEGTRIFYHKQKRIGGTELLDLVPARRIADGELGFYNLVNDTFLTNSGSGTLTGGNVVIHSNSTVINFTNDTGYITEINSTDVTTALGYTPVNPSSLATVATSGSYTDLVNTPTIPTVNDGTLTITQDGSTLGTFSANQAGDTTINVSSGVNGKADTDLSNVTNAGNIKMATASMPSIIYTDLTLGSSGTAYRTPANGWYTICSNSNGTYPKSIELINSSGGDVNTSVTAYNSSNSGWLRCSLPAKKGDVVVCYYNNISVQHFRFVYAQGSESEA